MIVHHETFSAELDEEFGTADLSDFVAEAVRKSGVDHGTATMFNAGSTGGLTTIEYEAGCLADLRAALDQIAPAHDNYDHNRRWGDGNGFSHLRAALMGPSLSVPIVDGRAAFSMWQQPIVINFDNHRRKRTVHITIVGE